MGIRGAFSDDVAIDLGTANTLVHAAGRGIIIDEPSVVAVSTRSLARDVIAVGQKAILLAQREPRNVELIRPLRDGVIADFVATGELLRHFIQRSRTMLGFRRPQVLICVPARATPVERRAVYDTAQSVGARKVHILEEPVAAALGAGLSLDDPEGAMVVDIGGGTTDVAVLAAGRVVESRSLRVAGYAMDAAIIRAVRRTHHLVIGEANAERIKIAAGAASPRVNGRDAEIHIRGRDLKEGRYKSVVLGPRDVAAALAEPIEAISDFLRRTLEELEPRLSQAIVARGIHLTGGGALLEGLDAELARRTGVAMHLRPNPTHCVVKGSGMVLERLSEYRRLLIQP